MKNNQYVNQYKYFIDKFNNNIWIPSLNIQYKPDNPDAWFDISKYISPINNSCNFKLRNSKWTKPVKCLKVKMVLNYQQKEILNRWFDAYTKMYNETLSFIKKTYIQTKE